MDHEKIERKTVNAFYQKQNVKPENFKEHHRISRFKRYIEKVSISTRGLKCSSSLQHIGNIFPRRGSLEIEKYPR